MATGRMIRKTISLNEQLADVSILARLLFTWGLAHTSDYGVIYGSPRRLKACVVPLSPETVEEVAAARDELLATGLWVAFECDGAEWIWYPGFDDNQDLHKRVANPRDGFPLPPQHISGLSAQANETKQPPATSADFREIPETSGKFREIAGSSPRTEQNRTEMESSPRGDEREGEPGKGKRRRPPPENIKSHAHAPNGSTATADDTVSTKPTTTKTKTNDRLLRSLTAELKAVWSPDIAEKYAKRCAELLAMPGETVSLSDLIRALRENNGPRGKEAIFACDWIDRVRRLYGREPSIAGESVYPAPRSAEDFAAIREAMALQDSEPTGDTDDD